VFGAAVLGFVMAGTDGAAGADTDGGAGAAGAAVWLKEGPAATRPVAAAIVTRYKLRIATPFKSC